MPGKTVASLLEHLDPAAQRELFEILPVGLVYCRVIYKDGQVDDIEHLYTNPAYHQLTGLGSVTGKRFSEIVPSFRETDPWILSTYGRLIENGEPIEFRRFVLGMNKWLSVRAYRPCTDHFIAILTDLSEQKETESLLVQQLATSHAVLNSSFIGLKLDERDSGEVFGALVDVAEARKAQQALAIERNRALEVIEAANIGTWEWDIQSGDTLINENWARLLGYAPSEISLKSLSDWEAFVHPDDLGPLNEVRDSHLGEKRPFYEFETRLRHKSGQWVWFHTRGRIMERGPNAEPLRMFGVIIDISDRIKAEQHKKENAERIQLALAGANLGTWESNLETRIASYDQRWCAMVGYTVDEMIQTIDGWLALMHPEDRIKVMAGFQRNFEEHLDYYDSEFRLRHKQGHWVWIYSRGKIFRNAAGAPTHAAGTHLDITDRKRLKSESATLLRQIEEMIQGFRDHPGKPETDFLPDASVEQLLSKRQLEVLKLIATGLTSVKIADCLGISRETVVGHRRDLMRKIGAHNTADIMRFAHEHRLIAG
jgi:PAS domain S-box-containing protein